MVRFYHLLEPAHEIPACGYNLESQDVVRFYHLLEPAHEIPA